jgi:hypothetical protein
MTGSFIKMGQKYGSTFAPTSDGLFDLIDRFYAEQSGIAKSAGSVGYGIGSANNEGYYNAIMGKEITAGIFACDNVFTALGARAYDHEGVRIQYEQASYGMASELNHGANNLLGWKAETDDNGNITNDYFAGIGAGTNQDGLIPNSVYLPVDDFREPYKEVPFSYDYGLGLQALESKDDTISYQAYVDKMSTNYSDLIDKTILRPLENSLPVAANKTYQHQYDLYGETSLQGIARCIASGTEIGKTYNGVEITETHVSPYGGIKGDFHSYRGKNAAGGTAHKENAIDGNVIDAAGATLDINTMRRAYRTASVNWDDSANPNGKMWAMSNVAQDKLGALMHANNMLLNTVYAQRDFNGVKTTPGRDAGILLNSFNNIPIIQDGNLNFDYSTKRVSAAKMGDIYLLDLKHIWMSMLTPVQMFNINNPAITRSLQERNVMNSRMEVRIDKFIGHCRIRGIQDDA